MLNLFAVKNHSYKVQILTKVMHSMDFCVGSQNGVISLSLIELFSNWSHHLIEIDMCRTETKRFGPNQSKSKRGTR